MGVHAEQVRRDRVGRRTVGSRTVGNRTDGSGGSDGTDHDIGPQSSDDDRVRELIRLGLDIVPGMVTALAANFPRHVDRSELVRAGSLGVVEAAWRFDPTRGVPFERFAARRVRGAVLDALRAMDWAPRSVRSAARRIDLVDAALTARFGRPATATEIGAELGIDAAKVQRVRAAAALGLVDRLDIDGDGESTIALADSSQPEPTAALERAELLQYLDDAVDSLSERHRVVIIGQFAEGRSTAALAEELGVSRSRVSQLRTEALDALRRRITGCYASEATRA